MSAVIFSSQSFNRKEHGIEVLSYPNFVRGLLLNDMQPLIGRFEILGTLCCTICEVPRFAGNQKEAGLRDP